MLNLNERPLREVIIVLGAAQKKNGQPGPAMQRRVAHAARLMKADPSPTLLLSGGCTVSEIAEAETMKRLALSLQVPETRIICEPRSRTTLENAANCADLLRGNRLASCLLVTDSFHMPRALMTFRAFGIEVQPEPVTARWTAATIISYLRELAARLVYPVRIRKYLNSRAE